MACLEHQCVRCDWWTTDNERGPVCCPKCGEDVRTTSDEDPRDFRDEYRDDNDPDAIEHESDEDEDDPWAV